MANLKYTTLRGLQKDKTFERNNFKREYKKNKQFKRKYQTLLKNQSKQRDYYIFKIKEKKNNTFKKTQKKIIGKTKKQISEIWQDYSYDKKLIFSYKFRDEISKEKNKSWFGIKTFEHKKYKTLVFQYETFKDISFNEIDYHIQNLINNKKNFLACIFYVNFLHNGVNEFDSKSYPSMERYNYNHFINWVNDIYILFQSKSDKSKPYLLKDILNYGIKFFYK